MTNDGNTQLSVVFGDGKKTRPGKLISWIEAKGSWLEKYLKLILITIVLLIIIYNIINIEILTVPHLTREDEKNEKDESYGAFLFNEETENDTEIRKLIVKRYVYESLILLVLILVIIFGFNNKLEFKYKDDWTKKTIFKFIGGVIAVGFIFLTIYIEVLIKKQKDKKNDNVKIICKNVTLATGKEENMCVTELENKLCKQEAIRIRDNNCKENCTIKDIDGADINFVTYFKNKYNDCISYEKEKSQNQFYEYYDSFMKFKEEKENIENKRIQDAAIETAKGKNLDTLLGGGEFTFEIVESEDQINKNNNNNNPTVLQVVKYNIYDENEINKYIDNIKYFEEDGEFIYKDISTDFKKYRDLSKKKSDINPIEAFVIFIKSYIGIKQFHITNKQTNPCNPVPKLQSKKDYTYEEQKEYDKQKFIDYCLKNIYSEKNTYCLLSNLNEEQTKLKECNCNEDIAWNNCWGRREEQNRIIKQVLIENLNLKKVMEDCFESKPINQILQETTSSSVETVSSLVNNTTTG